MKHLVLILLFMIGVSFGWAQGSIELPNRPFNHHAQKDTAILSWLKSSVEYNQLTATQQEMIYWVDFLRTRPQDFMQSIYLPFLEQFPEAACQEAQSLKEELKTTATLSKLSASHKLSQAASNQAAWVAKTGRLAHTGPNGKGFAERMKDAGIEGCGAENIFTGEPDVLMGLILLLIDKGVDGAGHRKNLLSPEFGVIGVGSVPYKNDQVVLDQIFACRE